MKTSLDPLPEGRRACTAVLAAAGVTLMTLPAHAAGFELVPPGARDLGRAGASIVGGDSPIAMFYNPATLLSGDRTINAEASVQIHLVSRCFQNVPVTESGDTRTAGTPAPTVCAGGPLTVIPEIAGSYRISKSLAVGLGLYVPAAAMRSFNFGDPNTVTITPPGGGSPIPTPTRYLLVSQSLLQVFPTLGVAYAPHPRVRLGLSFGAGVTQVDFTNVAWSHVTVISGLVTATADAKSHLTGTDPFVPRLQAGVWVEPVPSVPLEVGASFAWTDTVSTGNAKLAVDSLSTQVSPAAIGALVGNLSASGTFSGVGLRVPQTSNLALGARYAKKLDHPADDVGDRLSTERFDVELDGVVTFGDNVTSFDITPPKGATLVVPSPLPAILPNINVALPSQISIPHQWQTQLTLRLGGDFHPIPGLLSVRAGVSYDTNGVRHGYENIDFQPFEQVAVHVGATVRIAHRVDLTAAYAHVFIPTVTVSAQDAAIRRLVSGDANPSDPTQATLVNAGTYTGHADVMALSVAGHF